MEIGLIFPQTELGGDRGAVRAYGQAASDLGYSHLAAYDHVLGGDTAVHGDLGGPYDLHSTFHEPLLLFAYLAGFTTLRFATSILIGPQRQTALLAKQAAELDILSGGEFRLGLGSGWNSRRVRGPGLLVQPPGRLLGGAGAASYLPTLDAGERDRGRAVSPDYGGRSGSAAVATTHPHLDRGLRPGCAAPGGPHRRRVVPPGVRLGGGLERGVGDDRQEGAREVGRDPASIKFEGRLNYAADSPDLMVQHTDRWRESGASHMSINTMSAGCHGVDGHIAAITAMAELLL